ncbi:hypothetical protein WJT86_03405 [Microvirga sp. W0021]|uniref:AAA domain-containing protein n=1 Tax=Hohaiivirga grylli TaxID=3133970 RepID=A0ABV0BHD1_9HYPH
MSVYIDGIAIQFYKSIGADEQKIFGFKDFNFFIGENNSGKSTLLHFLHQCLANPQKTLNLTFLDIHQGQVTGNFLAKFCISKSKLISNCIEYGKNKRINIKDVLYFNEVVDLISDENNNIWFEFLFRYNKSIGIFHDFNELKSVLKHWKWQSLYRELYPNYSGGGC